MESNTLHINTYNYPIKSIHDLRDGLEHYEDLTLHEEADFHLYLAKMKRKLSFFFTKEQFDYFAQEIIQIIDQYEVLDDLSNIKSGLEDLLETCEINSSLMKRIESSMFFENNEQLQYLKELLKDMKQFHTQFFVHPLLFSRVINLLHEF